MFSKNREKLKAYRLLQKEFGLNYGNMNTLKHNRDKRTFRIEYLAYLAEGYGVSCEWLLLGTGPMFTQTCSKSEESQNL